MTLSSEFHEFVRQILQSTFGSQAQIQFVEACVLCIVFLSNCSIYIALYASQTMCFILCYLFHVSLCINLYKSCSIPIVLLILLYKSFKHLGQCICMNLGIIFIFSSICIEEDNN